MTTFNIEELSVSAKAEAMRYGHVAIVNGDKLTPLINEMSEFLEEGEHFSVIPLSKIAGSIFLYSVRIVPVVRIKAPE